MFTSIVPNCTYRSYALFECYTADSGNERFAFYLGAVKSSGDLSVLCDGFLSDFQVSIALHLCSAIALITQRF